MTNKKTTKRSPDRAQPPKLALIRRIALSLPEAVELKDRHGFWFNVRKKTFALYGMPSARWVLKLPKEQVKMLAEVAPDVFSPMIAGALYWAYVDVEKLTPAELRGYLEAAWRNTTPRKMHALLAAGPD